MTRPVTTIPWQLVLDLFGQDPTGTFLRATREITWAEAEQLWSGCSPTWDRDYSAVDVKDIRAWLVSFPRVAGEDMAELTVQQLTPSAGEKTPWYDWCEEQQRWISSWEQYEVHAQRTR